MARKKDLDDIPKRVSLRKNILINKKEWLIRERNTKDNELLKVIYKKILAAIGKPWNDTYSKLKPQLPKRLQSYLDLWVPTDKNCAFLIFVDDEGILRKGGM